jgi:hypothetical protein
VLRIRAVGSAAVTGFCGWFWVACGCFMVGINSEIRTAICGIGFLVAGSILIAADHLKGKRTP